MEQPVSCSSLESFLWVLVLVLWHGLSLQVRVPRTAPLVSHQSSTEPSSVEPWKGTFTLDESWLQAINVDPSSVNSVWLPTLLVTVGAYVIAVGFFNVYSMAVSTVFLCFLEDLERNDGSESKPYFMSKSLMDLMGKKNKKNKNVAETKSMWKIRFLKKFSISPNLELSHSH